MKILQHFWQPLQGEVLKLSADFENDRRGSLLMQNQSSEVMFFQKVTLAEQCIRLTNSNQFIASPVLLSSVIICRWLPGRFNSRTQSHD